jgi:hypothetical protein
LSDATRSIPEHEIVPDTRMTAGPLRDSALDRAEALVAVVAAALPPPVVPPPCVAHPTRPVPDGGVVGGGVVVPPPTGPIGTRRHCWLAPPVGAHWTASPPSAVDQPKTSRALPLWRLTGVT